MKPKIKNLDKTAKRILKAIKDKEKIILYGDGDADGISSVIILKETIKNLGGKVSIVYFPDRETENHGLNEKALEFLKAEAPGLIFLLDCGISNFQEIEKAKKMGFEVIIIDHHEILGKVPKASIIVNPKQKGDPYPFKAFAAAGLVYKLSEVLLKDKACLNLKESFLELAALATLSDMMPKIDDNKIFIEQGLRSLPNTFRPGLQALFEIEPATQMVDINQKIFTIISYLNAGKTKNHLNESYLLLSTVQKKSARNLAEKLKERKLINRQRIEEMTAEIKKMLTSKINPIVIFEGSALGSINLLGPVASRICQVYKRPTFIYQKGKEQSVGSVRMPDGLDGVKAMGSCSQYLKGYGGHPLAAGFTVLNENLEKFEKCLSQYFEDFAQNNI